VADDGVDPELVKAQVRLTIAKTGRSALLR